MRESKFDGSRGRARGKADATALIGMRVEDKHLFEVAIWERGPNDPQDWAPNPLLVDSTVRDCFERFNVVDFYADPSGGTGQVAAWEVVNYLILERSLDEDLVGLPFPDRADPAGFEQAVASFEWAVNTPRQGVVFDNDLARRKLDGVLVRLVSKPAHETVMQTVRRDGTAFARVPEPGACPFWLMLWLLVVRCISRVSMRCSRVLGASVRGRSRVRAPGSMTIAGVWPLRSSVMGRICRGLIGIWSSCGRSRVVEPRRTLRKRYRRAGSMVARCGQS